MGSSTGSGHVTNVANLEQLIKDCRTFTQYNPSNERLKLTALSELATTVRTLLNTLQTSKGELAITIAKRKKDFAGLNKLATRVYGAVQASDMPQEIKDTIKSNIDKLQGTRISARMSKEQKTALEATGEKVDERSSAQTGFEDKRKHLSQLIETLTATGQYAPNEEDLKLTSLRALHTTLEKANAEIATALSVEAEARSERQKIMYTNENTNLLDIAEAVKNYVKSVYDATSPEYKRVRKITFRSYD